MQGKDLALSMLIWVLEEDLSINTPGSDECWVESVDLVGCHDYFDVSAVVEAVELVEKFEHGSLNLTLASRSGFVALGTDGVDFIDEDYGRSVFGSDLYIVSNMLQTEISGSCLEELSD